MKKIFLLFPLLIITLTGCMDQEIVESHISYYEGIIKEISQNTLLLETPDNQTISFNINKSSTIEDLDIEDIVYIECEESNDLETKNIIKVDVLKDNIEVNLLSKMIYIHDSIYIESLPSETEEREGIIDGIINTAVLKNQQPTVHNQSNFGTGYEYKLINENRVDVFIDGQWTKFIKLSENIIYYNTYAFDQSSLSPDTISWLEKYNELSETEKQSISFVPSELVPTQTAMASNYVRTYHDAFIETDAGNIYIDIIKSEINLETQNIVISVNVINDTDKEYKLTENDIKLVKMHKVGDGFSSAIINKETSSALSTVSANSSISGTFTFSINVNFSEYELLLNTNSGMYRIPEPNTNTN